MHSSIIQLADAVTATINAAPAGTFDPFSFEAQRVLLPEYNLEKVKTLKIQVVPSQTDQKAATRGATDVESKIEIGIQKKINIRNEAEIAQLLALVEAIDDYLTQRELTGLEQFQWLRSANEPLYHPGHLQQYHVFTSVLTLTYKAMKTNSQ